jgi:putative tryptophan/tyrosine transport system substrate-binding protein
MRFWIFDFRFWIGESRARPLLVTLYALLMGFSQAAEAQQTGKIYRLGFLSPAAAPEPAIPTTSTLVPKLLRNSGYVEGQNLQVERRFAEGKFDRLPQLVKELVDLRMDVIVAVSPTAIKPALEATKSIPIVMGFGKDPVRDGFISSLAKPGGNITGVVVAPEDVLAGKRLELIKEAVPRAGTIAVLATSEASSKLQIKEAQKVAPALGVKLLIVEVQNSDYGEAFTNMSADKANALFVLASPILNAARDRVIQLAAKHRLAAIYEWPEHVEVGGMMAYGSSLAGLSARVAWYVERILKGTKPADLPVEQPTKFELVINLKTAKQIGLVIPPNVLARADRVIR